MARRLAGFMSPFYVYVRPSVVRSLSNTMPPAAGRGGPTPPTRPAGVAVTGCRPMMDVQSLAGRMVVLPSGVVIFCP